MQTEETIEFAIPDLKESISLLGEIVGKKDNEDMLRSFIFELLHWEMSIGEYKEDHPYDVIVCGAGHAGCEAALASQPALERKH